LYLTIVLQYETIYFLVLQSGAPISHALSTPCVLPTPRMSLITPVSVCMVQMMEANVEVWIMVVFCYIILGLSCLIYVYIFEF